MTILEDLDLTSCFKKRKKVYKLFKTINLNHPQMKPIICRKKITSSIFSVFITVFHLIKK